MVGEKKLKILMLEDNENDALLIERVLRKNDLVFERECVDTREEFNESIHRFKPDVILSDHGLPAFNSREALKISLKERSEAPFILVTGTVSDDFAISCLQEGADDYILKSNISRLPAAIRSALKKRKLEKLKREARHALRKQNDELRKVNRELDNFVYSVSHNLRGPLASQIGVWQIAKEENKDPHIDSLLNMMGESMRKLDLTLSEILDYSRNAREELQSKEINWSELFRQSFDKLEHLKQYRSVVKNISLETPVPFYSDENRLCIILTNVLTNAIQYCNSDGNAVVNLLVKTSPADAEITISDNGFGIRHDVLPKVFDMFFRGTEQSSGAGLGLYIVKEIVARLKGEVTITSTEGKGTTLHLKIPTMRTE